MSREVNKQMSVKKETETRIPENLTTNNLLAEFCRMYLVTADEIAEYNKSVLTERTDGWTNAKVLEKAKELGNPTDANIAPVTEIADFLTKYEDYLTAFNFARKELLEATAKHLGIVLTATNERDQTVEGPLKEKRNQATQIALQLGNIANMTADTVTKEAVKEFLESNPLPMVGRDQVRNFNAETSSVPRYRVDVTVTKGGDTLLTTQGFSKAAAALSNSKFGYERGKSLNADDLRLAWEKAGNSATSPYAVSPVTFEDNGLVFTITKRA